MTASSGPTTASAPSERLAVERYLAAHVAKADRDRGLVCVQSTGAVAFATWDVRTGTLQPTGIETDGFMGSSWLSADGRALFRLADDHGNELGHVERVALYSPAAPVDLTPGISPYTLRGGDCSQDGSSVVFAPVNADGFMLASAPSDGCGESRVVYCTPNEAWNPRVSGDAGLAAIDTTDHNPGLRQFAVTVFNLATGEKLATLSEPGPGSVTGVCFSPVLGDPRLLVSITGGQGGFTSPAIWNPLTGDVDAITTPWDGTGAEIVPLDWSPGGAQVLLVVQRFAEQTLAVHDLDSGATTPLELPPMSYWLPEVRQSAFATGGDVLAMGEDADTPMTVLRWSDDVGVSAVLRGPVPPAGRKARSVTFESADGTPIQAWLIVPGGEGPHPTVVHVHGGPHWFAPDCYNPEAQAWVDRGFAYLDVNYRGSTGRGTAFAHQIWGDLGNLELADLSAARAFLVSTGVAAPASIFLTGESYGGFLTLHGLGRQPDLWAGGFAVVAIADWTLAYRDASAALQAAMRSWFGGSPDQVPGKYVHSSPITHAANLCAPVVVLQGRHDTRTPPAQMHAYEERLRELGKDVAVEWFDAGHGLEGAEFSAWALDLFEAKARTVLDRADPEEDGVGAADESRE